MPEPGIQGTPEGQKPPETIRNPEIAGTKEGEILPGPDFVDERPKQEFAKTTPSVIPEAASAQEPPTIKEMLGRVGREEILYAKSVIDNPERHTEWELEEAQALLALKEARDLLETKPNE